MGLPFRRRKVEITGFNFGPIEVQKVGRNRWKWIQAISPDPNVLPLIEYVSGPAETVGARAKAAAERTKFLWKLQAAVTNGKLSPMDMYRILAKYDRDGGRCKIEHVHSAKCDYHPHHPEPKGE